MGTEKKALIERKHNRIAKMREQAVMVGINWTLGGNVKVHKNQKFKKQEKELEGREKQRGKYIL